VAGMLERTCYFLCLFSLWC